MIKRALCLFSLFIAISTQAHPNLINSSTIVKETLAALPNCLHYQVSPHFCIWISEWGEVNTTPIINHYLPDLVISVFRNPRDNPWLEVNRIVDSVGQPIQEKIVNTLTGIEVGSGNHNHNGENVIFKEADVIGNPTLALLPAHGLLPSAATPWKPYFQSMTDSVLWRGFPPMALPEEAAAVSSNVIHHVGLGLTNWGGVLPHAGKVISDNDVKASAVIAQRAGDLVTRPNQFGHIYKLVSNSCGQNCTAVSVKENSKETYFQMIYPISQHDCHILGSQDSYTPAMINHKGAYVWIVWRHYEGCADGEGEYIGKT